MSLIQFRGRSILPPLVHHDSVEKEDLQMKEDDFILSLSSSEALQVILCGLPDDYSDCTASIKPKVKQDMEISKPVYNEEKIFTNFKECNKNLFHKKLSEEVPTNKVNFINYKQSIGNLKHNTNNKESILHPVKNMALLSSGDESGLGSCHSPWRNISNQEDRISSENSEFSKSFNNTSPPSTSPSKVLSGVTNHQKLKVLKASGKNSSSYLQDYLQLLTSRSEITRVPKPKRETELRNEVFLERRGSAPLLPSKKCIPSCDRKRTSSGSSDKSGNYRSLGSTYLDSYLGNLTDHSWIIYPTGDASSNSTEPIGEKSILPALDSINVQCGDYLQRRLRFINPEKFFAPEIKMDTQEEPSHSTTAMKSSSSAENDNELGLTDTSGIVLSPDISSSSLDTDKLDASNPLSLTSLQEIDELKESPKSQELSENKDNTQESSYNNSDTSPEDKSLNSKNEERESVKGDLSSSKLNVTFDNKPDEIICTRDALNSKLNVTFDSEPIEINFPNVSNPQTFNEKITQEEDEMKDEESTIASDDSSDLSTDDDAEDQVSMIVCDIQKSPESLHGESKESLCDDSLATNPNSNSLLTQASSDFSAMEKTALSNDENSEPHKNEDKIDKSTDKLVDSEILSKFIQILKTKQEEELKELKKRHEREMDNFVCEMSKLTSSQKLSLVNAYESPNNNNSLNDILKAMNNTSQISDQESDTSVTNDDHRENYNTLSSFNHTNLMPSFFLHDESQENNCIRRPDVNKISQIFTPSKGNVQTVAKFLNLSPTLLAANSTNETDAQILVTDAEQNESTKQLFSQKQLEVGLDLVPTRESDGVCTSSSSSLTLDSNQDGICKLQAIVRGKRIRKLMRTSQVQQLLSTLKEVAKLAHQFHQDILMDNIRKGDIGFHKALYNEEQQAREKLLNIMVNMSPVDQIHVIERDRLIEQRENRRRVTTEQPRSNANHIPKLKLYSSTSSSCTTTEPTSKTQSSPRTLLMSPYKGNLKQIPRKVYTSELPRPCKTYFATESKTSNKHPCTSPRERQSLIPSQKSLVSKGIPKHKILKKIDTLPQTHIPPKRQNAPICKSDSGYLSNAGAKATPKMDRSLAPIRGDVISSRKPWR